MTTKKTARPRPPKAPQKVDEAAEAARADLAAKADALSISTEGLPAAQALEERLAEEAAAKIKPKAGITHLMIASVSPEGFRRCGRRWGPVADQVPVTDFSEAQIEVLRNDPNLIVTALSAPAGE